MSADFTRGRSTVKHEGMPESKAKLGAFETFVDEDTLLSSISNGDYTLALSIPLQVISSAKSVIEGWIELETNGHASSKDPVLSLEDLLFPHRVPYAHYKSSFDASRNKLLRTGARSIRRRAVVA